jgi:hypothetical protein
MRRIARRGEGILRRTGVSDYWAISFDLVGSGIRQNAEKAMQAFDTFLLSSGELSEAPALWTDESDRQHFLPGTF